MGWHVNGSFGSRRSSDRHPRGKGLATAAARGIVIVVGALAPCFAAGCSDVVLDPYGLDQPFAGGAVQLAVSIHDLAEAEGLPVSMRVIGTDCERTGVVTDGAAAFFCEDAWLPTPEVLMEFVVPTDSPPCIDPDGDGFVGGPGPAEMGRRGLLYWTLQDFTDTVVISASVDEVYWEASTCGAGSSGSGGVNPDGPPPDPFPSGGDMPAP